MTRVSSPEHHQPRPAYDTGRFVCDLHRCKRRGGGQFEWRANAHRTCSPPVVLATCSAIRRATLPEVPRPPAIARPGVWPCASRGDSLKLERPIAKEQPPSHGSVTKTLTNRGAVCSSGPVAPRCNAFCSFLSSPPTSEPPSSLLSLWISPESPSVPSVIKLNPHRQSRSKFA